MNPFKWLIILPVKFYQWFISPIIGPRCRFYPTCSHYTIEAVEKHGVFCGSWLAIKRISKCHPGNDGGIDFVPECGCGECKTPEDSKDPIDSEHSNNAINPNDTTPKPPSPTAK